MNFRRGTALPFARVPSSCAPDAHTIHPSTCCNHLFRVASSTAPVGLNPNPRNQTEKAARLCGFSVQEPRRIRDPSLTRNPSPNHAESVRSKGDPSNDKFRRALWESQSRLRFKNQSLILVTDLRAFGIKFIRPTMLRTVRSRDSTAWNPQGRETLTAPSVSSYPMCREDQESSKQAPSAASRRDH